jgi:hypothetical protein
MKIQTPGTGGLARSIFCHETGLPEKPPLQATRKGGKWRVVHKQHGKRKKHDYTVCMEDVEFVPPHEDLEMIMARSGIRYSQQLVRLFVETIPAYLPGTMVKMSDGRNAIVTKIIEHMQRPYVRYIDTHEEIALADHPSLLIVGQAL